MEKIRKTIRKQGFFDDVLSILTVFWSLFNFGSILAQKLNRFICEKKNWIFWHPGHPWSCESSGEGKIRALSDTVHQSYIIYVLRWAQQEHLGHHKFLMHAQANGNIEVLATVSISWSEKAANLYIYDSLCCHFFGFHIIWGIIYIWCKKS